MATSDTVSIHLSNPTDVEELMSLAEAVEQAGFTRAWLPETVGLEAGALGGAIARQTSLEIGTAIVPVYTRTPALLAMMAATWSRLGGGRPVHLGIGSGGQVIVDRWHGVPFDLPGTTTRETLRIIRQALSGERTDFEGRTRRSHGMQMGGGAAPEVRVHIGGMGPAMMALAVEEADGLILTWQSPRTLRDLKGNFDTSVQEAGREEGDCRLIARVYVSVTPDPDLVREEVRKEMVEYLVSPPYAKYFRAAGFEEEVNVVNERFQARDRQGAVAGVSDRLLGEMLVVGRSGEEIADQLTDYLSAGADELLLQPVVKARGGDPLLTVWETAKVLLH